jgi:hypothetical protein
MVIIAPIIAPMEKITERAEDVMNCERRDCSS